MANTSRVVCMLARLWRAVDSDRVGEQGRAGEAADAERSNAMAGAGLLVLAANLTVGAEHRSRRSEYRGRKAARGRTRRREPAGARDEIHIPSQPVTSPVTRQAKTHHTTAT